MLEKKKNHFGVRNGGHQNGTNLPSKNTKMHANHENRITIKQINKHETNPQKGEYQVFTDTR